MTASPGSRVVVITDDAIVEVSTAVGFCRLLRQIKGERTLGALRLRSEISRSQIQAMTREGRTTLPTLEHQVRRLVEACQLPERQVLLVMETWHKLRKISLADGVPQR